MPDDRAQLAALLDRFRRGELTIWAFERQAAPLAKSADRAAAALAADCGALGAADLFGWRRFWSHLAPASRQALERSGLFLRTTLPYEWPDPPELVAADVGQAALLIAWMAALGNMLFGLVLCVWLGLWLLGGALIVLWGIVLTGAGIAAYILKRWQKSAMQRYESAGEVQVWPFLRRADYECVLIKQAAADGPTKHQSGGVTSHDT